MSYRNGVWAQVTPNAHTIHFFRIAPDPRHPGDVYFKALCGQTTRKKLFGYPDRVTQVCDKCRKESR